MKEEITPGCIPPGGMGRYSIGFDAAAPGGDKSILVVYDRLKAAIIQIEEVPQTEPERVVEALRDFARASGIKDPDQYIPNPAGVDDQGEAIVVEPLALPAPPKGRSATAGGVEIYPEALAAREWIATKAGA